MPQFIDVGTDQWWWMGTDQWWWMLWMPPRVADAWRIMRSCHYFAFKICATKILALLEVSTHLFVLKLFALRLKKELLSANCSLRVGFWPDAFYAATLNAFCASEPQEATSKCKQAQLINGSSNYWYVETRALHVKMTPNNYMYCGKMWWMFNGGQLMSADTLYNKPFWIPSGSHGNWFDKEK
jgi:hypothetical protein